MTIPQIDDIVRVTQDGAAVVNKGRLAAKKMHADERLPVRFLVENTSQVLTLEGLGVRTNLPRRMYTATHPPKIGPGETAEVVITLLGPPLFLAEHIDTIRLGIACVPTRYFDAA